MKLMVAPLRFLLRFGRRVPRRAIGAALVAILLGAGIAWLAYSGTGRVPEPGEILSFECQRCASPYFKGWVMDRAQLEEILSTYDTVSEQVWLHEYSHVALNDQNGIVRLKDGAVVNWLVRPGGLAMLTFEDGRKVFLAKESGLPR